MGGKRKLMKPYGFIVKGSKVVRPTKEDMQRMFEKCQKPFAIRKEAERWAEAGLLGGKAPKAETIQQCTDRLEAEFEAVIRDAIERAEVLQDRFKKASPFSAGAYFQIACTLEAIAKDSEHVTDEEALAGALADHG